MNDWLYQQWRDRPGRFMIAWLIGAAGAVFLAAGAGAAIASG